jgi:hypothetical protein
MAQFLAAWYDWRHATCWDTRTIGRPAPTGADVAGKGADTDRRRPSRGGRAPHDLSLGGRGEEATALPSARSPRTAPALECETTASAGAPVRSRCVRSRLRRRVLDARSDRAANLAAFSGPLSPQWGVASADPHGLEFPAAPAPSRAARRREDCALDALWLAANKKSVVPWGLAWALRMKVGFVWSVPSNAPGLRKATRPRCAPRFSTTPGSTLSGRWWSRPTAAAAACGPRHMPNRFAGSRSWPFFSTSSRGCRDRWCWYGTTTLRIAASRCRLFWPIILASGSFTSPAMRQNLIRRSSSGPKHTNTWLGPRLSTWPSCGNSCGRVSTAYVARKLGCRHALRPPLCPAFRGPSRRMWHSFFKSQ